MPLSLRTSSTTYPCHIPHSTWSASSSFIFPSNCPCYLDYPLLVDYYDEHGTSIKLVDWRHDVHIFDQGHLPSWRTSPYHPLPWAKHIFSSHERVSFGFIHIFLDQSIHMELKKRCWTMISFGIHVISICIAHCLHAHAHAPHVITHIEV